MTDKVLITGITGQISTYLAKYLLEKGYKVFGGMRRSSSPNISRLEELGIEKDIEFIQFELLEPENIYRTIQTIKPQVIYSQAAQSHVHVSFEQPIFTANVTGMGVLHILEAIRKIDRGIKLYQASSSEMIGGAKETPQTEKTSFYPKSPYAVSKVFAHQMCINYREAYNMFVCCGILFNSESPLRSPEFVTRKITQGVANIKHGLQDKIILGNLNSKRDWSHAQDSVKAMVLMMEAEKAKEYVISSNETHTIREFVELAFKVAGTELGWEGKDINEKGIDRANNEVLVEVSKEFFRPAEVDILHGDSTKIRTELGWQPEIGFDKLVSLMVEADLRKAMNKKWHIDKDKGRVGRFY